MKNSPLIDDHFYQTLYSNSKALTDSAKCAFQGAANKEEFIRTSLQARSPASGLPPFAAASLLCTIQNNDGAQSERLRAMILNESRELRQRLWGSDVAIMVPLEISSFCSSNCTFCGWRTTNKEMLRLKVSEKSIDQQLDYISKFRFSHIEMVAGDDLSFIKNELAATVQFVKNKITHIMPGTRFSICLTPLFEDTYRDLKEKGLDAAMTWQETYNSELYKKYVTSGPKAHGITRDYKVAKVGTGDEGCLVRMKSNELAARAGLQIGLGVMLGLDEEHPEADMMAVIAHGTRLIKQYGEGLEPIIIGLPTWNPITTPNTDNSKYHQRHIEPERDLELIAAIYLLSFPDRMAWLFPTCRVSKPTQVASIKTAGCLTSGMASCAPGAYLDYPTKADITSSFSKSSVPLENLTKEQIINGEQFTHHFDSQENYEKLFHDSKIEIVQERKFLAALTSLRAKRDKTAA